MPSFIHRLRTDAGFTLIEVLIAAALITLVFGGIFGSMQLLMVVVNNSKAKAGATALAAERLEYLQALDYDQLGTLSSPPYGVVPAQRTVTLNEKEYNETVDIRFVDDPADGVGYGGDNNGVPDDYKYVTVEVAWDDRGTTRSVTIGKKIVPFGVENNMGGGSIRVQVQDADGVAVPFTEVVIRNNTLATTTDTTLTTNENGELLLSGLPAGDGYSISATKTNYSTDQTYEPTGTMPNPYSRHLTVQSSLVATKGLVIDRLSDIVISTVDTTGTTTIALPNVTLQVQGNKLIADDPTPVYKSSAQTVTTDSGGSTTLSDREWDNYSVRGVSGYRIAELCPQLVLELDPNTTLEATASMVPTDLGVLMNVTTTTGVPISNADVLLRRGAYTATAVTSVCGQVYFGDTPVAADDYEYEISASGYVTMTGSLEVSTDAVVTVALPTL